jgi:Asp-tRNA(Asn)/Glu-tRNA(Gln) amidotransferase A subunit family amidase
VTRAPAPETILACAEQIRAGELTSSALTESVLTRAAETEPYIRAFAYIDEDAALKAAQRADEEIRHGIDRGPLHGIPVGVKDVFCTAQMPTRAGSMTMGTWPCHGDSAAVARLADSGAIIVGKHVTHEFACGQNVPPARNAWDQRCYPGGSTAGGGPSVAVGSSLAAIGTDAGGSVRKPAALNGVVGLKPTLGMISRQGIVPPSGSMDHVGMITRTVEDAAALLEALRGREGSPSAAPGSLADADAHLKGARLGIWQGLADDGADEAVAETVATALEAFQAAGAVLCPVHIPELSMAVTAGSVIIQAEAGISHGKLLASSPGFYGEETRRYLEAGLLIPAAYLRAAYLARAEIAAAVRKAFTDLELDAIVSPTTPMTAMTVEQMNVSRDLPRYIHFTVIANLTGWPAITIPCGFADGMPVGLQIMGPPYAESRLLGLAHAYEKMTSWATIRPPLCAAGAASED